jgi:branched-subunit amino acid aminotransferase/4-amino-4-deoxychorismate lyase
MKNTLPWVSINGIILPRENATVSIFDNGFLYGFGVFTTVKVRDGVPLFFERHANRLEKNLEQLNFSQQVLSHDFVKTVQRVIEKNKMQDGGIRITLTPTTCIIHATTITPKIENVSVLTVPDERDQYKTVKMTYRIPHILAQQKADEQGCQDALFVLGNNLVESTYANIFSFHNGEIITPPIANRGLNGISRQVLLDQLPIEEQEITVETTNPMVLVSSLSLRVVEKIDDREIKKNEEFVQMIKNALEKAEKEYIHIYAKEL